MKREFIVAACAAMGIMTLPSVADALTVPINVGDLAEPAGISWVQVAGAGVTISNDTTLNLNDGVYELRSVAQGVFGSFTITNDAIVATTGAVYQTMAGEIAFDRSLLAQVYVDMDGLTEPANYGTFAFSGNNYLLKPETFWLPAGDYKFQTRGGHNYGTVTVSPSLITTTTTGALVSTPSGFSLDTNQLAEVNLDFGDITQPRGHIAVGIGNVYNILPLGRPGKIFLPPGTYDVVPRAAPRVGQFTVASDLSVAIDNGLTLGADNTVLIDRDAQGSFELAGFSTPEGFARTQINEMSWFPDGDTVYYLGPGSYKIVTTNHVAKGTYGYVNIDENRQVTTTTGLETDGFTVRPDLCEHHQIRVQPTADAAIRYVLFGHSTIIENEELIITLPDISTNRLISYDSPKYDGYFDLGANGLSQTHFPDAENPILVLEELSCLIDMDEDGIEDGLDNCLEIPNSDQSDSDNDQVGDACDLCAGDDGTGDTDIDGVCDGSDNCPSDMNNSQADADLDGIGDACELDTDEDGVDDDVDNCPADSNPLQADLDQDGFGDTCDSDDDGDGVADSADNCPNAANAGQADTDSDGSGDTCDGDDDGDGVADEVDLCPASSAAVPVNADGCSGSQHVELVCGDASTFKNHGQYVRCVAHASKQAVDEGLISAKERAAIVKAAAKNK